MAATARQPAPESPAKAGFVTRCGNVVPVADGAPEASIDVAAYVAAIVLAGAAAFFSIKGLVVLFPGASLVVVVMALAMEGAKLVTAGWLARRWRVTALVWRVLLAALVAGLAVINAISAFINLSAPIWVEADSERAIRWVVLGWHHLIAAKLGGACARPKAGMK